MLRHSVQKQCPLLTFAMLTISLTSQCPSSCPIHILVIVHPSCCQPAYIPFPPVLYDLTRGLPSIAIRCNIASSRLAFKCYNLIEAACYFRRPGHQRTCVTLLRESELRRLQPAQSFSRCHIPSPIASRKVLQNSTDPPHLLRLDTLLNVSK
jgi:hypothetical protein